MQGLWIPSLLVIVALGLLLLELLTFTGGLAFVAALVYIGSVALAYYQTGTETGTIFLVASLFGSGFLSIAAVRWAPRSWLGRDLFNRPPRPEEVAVTGDDLAQAVGQIGVAACDMLPGGVVQLGSRKFEAVSDGGAIDKGNPVRVVAVRGRRLVVRPEAAAAGQAAESMEQSIADPFEEPFA